VLAWAETGSQPAAPQPGRLDSARRFGHSAPRKDEHMAARIYQRYRNAMQAGRALKDEWVVEFESKSPRRADPLTGWAGGGDTASQVQMVFPSAEAAQAYAEREGLHYHLVPAAQPKLKLQSYADNFK
jgi:hypothetical protein